MSDLNFRVGIDDKTLQSDISRINRTISQWSQHTQREAANVDRTFQKLGAVVAGYFSINFAANFAKQIATVRGEFQQLEVAFETMLGNKAKADKLMAEVVEFASTTPFELKDVAGATKMLLAYGTATEEIIPTMRALGDVSAGLSIPIERLILNYGQVRMQAKLTGKELRDFAVMGVPIIAELAKNMNKTELEIQEMVSAGKVGFKDVEDAFKSMAGEGGRFSNLMEKQSATITGMISNLQDAWTKMMNSIGQANEGSIMAVISTAKSLVENYQTVIDILKVLVVTYGTYKAALIATTIAQKASITAGNIQAWIQLTKHIKTAKDAQIAFNLATKANPYVLAATAIVGIVSAFVAFGKGAKDATDKSAVFRDELSKETKAINDAFSALKTVKQGTDQHKSAIQAINDKYGQYLPKLLTEKDSLTDVATAQRDVTKAIIETIAARNKESAIQPYVASLTKQTSKYNELLGKMTDGMSDVLTAQTEAYVDNYLQQITEKIKSGTDVTITQVKQGLQGLYKDVTGNELPLNDFSDLASRMRVVAYASKELKREQDSLDTQMREYIKTIKELSDEYQETGTVSIETITQLIQRTQAELAEAKQQLSNLRMGDAAADETAINDTIDRIGQLEKKLENLTGISKKATDDMLKNEQERLNALEELRRTEIDIISRIENEKIALMQESAQKRIAQAEQNYKDELQKIKDLESERLKLFNDTLPNDQRVTVLPEDIQSQFDELRRLAAEKKAQEIEEINQNTAEKVNEIWAAATDFFLTQQEREINAVNEKYEKLIQAAQKIGDNDLVSQLQKSRTAELEKIDSDYAIKRIEGLQNINDNLMQQAEMEISINKKKYIELLEQALEYERAKLEIAKADPTKSDEDIVSIETRIKAIQRAIKSFKDANKEDLFEIIAEVSNFLGEYNEAFKGIGDVSKGIGKVVAGDLTGVLNIFKGVVALMELQGKKEEQWQKAQLEALNAYLTKTELVFKEIEKSINRAFGTERLDQFRKGIQSLGNELTWAVNEINRLAKASLLLPEKDAIIGYRGDSISGAGGRPGGQPIYGFSIESIEKAIQENEARVKKLILQYAQSGDEQTRTILQAYDKYIDQLYALKNEYQRLITGTTREDIANSIIDGFKQGKTSAQEFADDFEQMMKQALISAMKMQVLEGPLNDFYNDFAASLSDGQLTPDEVASLRQTYNAIIAAADEWQRSIEQVTGISPFGETTGQKGLTGAIKGITEETASLIAGQFFAFREVQQRVYDVLSTHTPIHTESLSVMKQMHDTQNKHYLTGIQQLDAINTSVTHLAAIERNTRDIEKLSSIDQKLSDMNNYLKQIV